MTLVRKSLLLLALMLAAFGSAIALRPSDKMADERPPIDLKTLNSALETLVDDPTKAKEKLRRTPKTSLQDLVKEMVQSDYSAAKQPT